MNNEEILKKIKEVESETDLMSPYSCSQTIKYLLGIIYDFLGETESEET